jgi:GNAT superfamily N-acetyltransferase
MDVIQIDLTNKKQVKDFMRLPFRLYRDVPQWVPPLRMDIKRALGPKRNLFFQHSEAAFFMAYRDRLPVGRIAVINNKPYNEYMGSRAAFFWFFESEDDPQIASCLFEAAFAWARSQGLNQIIGPKGFTPLDGFGLLVEGFQHRPAFGLPYNPAYYIRLIEAQGFKMQGESVSGHLDESLQFPPRVHELAEVIAKRRGLRIASCRTRAELRKLIPYLKEIYNSTLEDRTGNIPMTNQEMDNLANSMLWLADPKLIKFVLKDDKAVGFLLAYPDVSAALQKTRGRLFPFGWLTVLLELRRTEWININGAGLLPEYQGSGGTAILFSEIFKSFEQNGRYRHADLVQIGLENERMLREMEKFGIDFYKKHRVYEIDL